MAKASKHFEQKIQILIIFEGLGQNLVDLVYPGPGAQGPPLVSLVAQRPSRAQNKNKTHKKQKKKHKSTHAVVESTFMFFLFFVGFFLCWAWEALQSLLLRAPY